jgi:N6-L-threonylcarbamoyladenine synthase
MIASNDLDFSFSGLKTAVATAVRGRVLDDTLRADLAAEFQAAAVDVLVAKALGAVDRVGVPRLVVAGGVGANRSLRARLTAAASTRGVEVFYPPLEFCTDNGAMIAFAGALRLTSARRPGHFAVRPRWELASLHEPPGTT